jgi:hypothetical protein
MAVPLPNRLSYSNTRSKLPRCARIWSHTPNRIYSCVTTPQIRAAQELAPKIKAGKIGTNGFFTSRDIYLKGWSGIDTPDLARSATQVAGGRPSVRYQINPKVRPLAQLASGPSDNDGSRGWGTYTTIKTRF